MSVTAARTNVKPRWKTRSASADRKPDRHGYTVTKVYKDAALSGQLSEDQRPGFQAMQEAAKRKEFDVLIVDDASRLSRDQSDALRTLKRFELWGVGLIARSDKIGRTMILRSGGPHGHSRSLGPNFTARSV